MNSEQITLRSFVIPGNRLEEVELAMYDLGFHGYFLETRPDHPDGLFGMPGTERLEALQEKVVAWLHTAGFQENRTEVKDLEEWIRPWKESLRPFEIYPGTWVLPDPEKSHEIPKGTKILKILPSYAFGTGHHATTSTASALVAETVRPGSRVRDVGCGTGILALVARLAGAKTIHARDFDALSIDRARAAFHENGSSDILLEEASLLEGLSERGEIYDVIAANIVTEVLAVLLDDPHLVHLLIPGGQLILSGIREAGLPILESRFLRDGWQLRDRRDLDGWITLLLQRRAG